MDGIFIAIQILAGLCLGSFFYAKIAGRRLADLRASLEKQEEKIDKLQIELRDALEEKSFLSAQLQSEKEKQSHFDETKKQFVLEFENISNKILKANSQEFAISSQEKINNLLSPLQQKMETFQTSVQEIYKTGNMERLTLKNTIETIADTHKNLAEETGRLARALKGDVKKQGCWGELVLQKVLESSGLRENEEYVLQGIGLELQTEAGRRLQPDVVVNLPDKKRVVIDSKMSYLHYDNYFNSVTDLEKEESLKKLIASVREHIRGLSEKNYHFVQTLDSPEFVLMFVPIEAIFSLVVEAEPALFEEAWKKSIILVSPANLLAVLRTIESIWKVERQNRNTQKIAEEAASLYDKFVDFLRDLEGVEKSLKNTHEHFDKAMGKLSLGRGNLIKKTEDLKRLGLKTKKQIPVEYLEEVVEVE